MIMARLKVDSVGYATTYVCEDLEAGLPAHAHPPGSGLEHDVRCVEGKILVYTHPNWRTTLSAGERLEFDTTRWHGVVPLTVGASFINTCKQPIPEFHSVLDSPHNAPSWATS